MRRRNGPEDFKRVTPTPEEVEAWKKAEAKRGYSNTGLRQYRVECRACGTRIWGSGIGIGSHRKACKGAKRDIAAWMLGRARFEQEKDGPEHADYWREEVARLEARLAELERALPKREENA